MVKPLEYVPEHFNIKLEMANECFMMIAFSVFICLRKSTLQGWLKGGVFLKPPPLESKILENPYS